MYNLADVSVLVTGAAGFIGSHLTHKLLKEGAKVHAFDVAKSHRLDDVRDKIVFDVVDLTDLMAVTDAVKGIEPVKVFHLAAKINREPTLDILEQMIRVNVIGSLNILRALEGVDYECFINTGSSEVYGGNKVPFREDQQPFPISPYSASKAAATMFLKMQHETTGCPIVTLRPCPTYGPMQDPVMLIPQIIVSAIQKKNFKMTEGIQTREYNYIDDIVDGFMKAATTKKAAGEIINLGNGVEFRVRDIASKINELMGNPIKIEAGALPYREGEIMRLFCDNSKARKVLGWRPKVGLEEGLRKTIAWYIDNENKWME